MPDHGAEVVLDGSPLTIGRVHDVAVQGAWASIAASVRPALKASRGVIESMLDDGEAHYGINTGFGSLSKNRIGRDELAQLQVNLVRSHAAGVGAPLDTPSVRATMLCLAASLCRGLSGVRPELPELIVGLLNHGITPIVPEVGSVGASGDLAPLSHIAEVLIGEGRVLVGEQEMGGAEAMEQAGLAPIALSAKEGLALINGTHLMCGRAALIADGLERLFDAAVAATAMSMDACKATDSFLDPRVHAARGHEGSSVIAERLRRLLEGSEILPSHRENDPRVQDPYSLRCAPYVLGAAWDLWNYVKLQIERELGAVTDNPLVFADDSGEPVVSAGNFHGMPIAIPLDAIAIALSHIAGISERRTFLMLAAGDPVPGLTPYLSKRPGVQSGLMIAQYTAAACCNELIGLAAPASVANLSTSAGVEDYNSFGPRSAAKAMRALELARSVVAIEMVCAAQGIEAHRPLKSGAGVEHALASVREVVEPFDEDRSPAPDFAALSERIEAGAFADAL